MSCYISDVSLAGTDMTVSPLVAQSAQDCQKLCNSMVGCYFFVYNIVSLECKLKSDNTGVTNVSGLISGPANCSNLLSSLFLYGSQFQWFTTVVGTE